MSAGLHCRNLTLGINVLGYHELMWFSNSVSTSEYNFGGQGSYPEGANKKISILTLKNFLLKKEWGGVGGRGGDPNFFIFLVWSALIVCGWIVVAWSRNSCLGPAKIASFVFLVYSVIGDPV